MLLGDLVEVLHIYPIVEVCNSIMLSRNIWEMMLYDLEGGFCLVPSDSAEFWRDTA